MSNKKIKKTIGIWGNYNYGNFGDDLMAISIGKYLVEKNKNIIVFRLDNHIANEYGLKTEFDLETFIKKIDVCIIGGGGMLVPNSFLKQKLSKVARKFENDFKQLNILLNKYKVDIYPVSIGGIGRSKINLPKERERFFKSNSVKNGTVRIKGDIDLLVSYGKQYRYIPDILLNTPNIFNLSKVNTLKTNEKEFWIGINLIKKDIGNDNWIMKLLSESNSNPNLKVFIITTHLSDSDSHYELMPDKKKFPNVLLLKYTKDICLFLKHLKSFDLMISSKLHLGLTALSFGTPFFNYNGRGKTVAFLKSIDGEAAILKTGFNLETFKENYFLKPKSETIKIYNLEKLEKMKSQSKENYLFLDEVIDNHS